VTGTVEGVDEGVDEMGPEADGVPRGPGAAGAADSQAASSAVSAMTVRNSDVGLMDPPGGCGRS
jgi:hypothetical protein